MKLPDHLFTSDIDGALYDTRAPGWSAVPPLRPVFALTYAAPDTAAKIKATLRAGEYAWPGGYPLFLICEDGEPLSFDSARANLAEILAAMSDRWGDKAWRIAACEINYEDGDLTCSHSGKPIPAAYA